MSQPPISPALPHSPVPLQRPAVEDVAQASIPTELGRFEFHVFRQVEPERGSVHHEHVALVMGEVKGRANVAVRVHSECLTGEVFGSQRCDCRAQLEAAQAAIANEGVGIIVYLRQEGRGIGLANKIKAYALQDQGADTVDANRLLHLPIDARDYGVAAAILARLGVTSVRLMTNNPSKVSGLQAFGIAINERLPLVIAPTEHSSGYLQTKRQKLQHDIPSSALGNPVPTQAGKAK